MPELKPPMVGREQEMETLLSSLGQALIGNGDLVLISGEAGIGKTKLSSELCRAAASAGCSVLIGRGLPGAPIPYLPFEEALRNQGAGPMPHNPKGVIEENVARPYVAGAAEQAVASSRWRGIAEAQSENEMIMFSILQQLTILSKQRTTLLLIEDLHWADSSSIQLLIFLARNIQAMKVMILATYRSEELRMDRRERRTPLLDALRIMRREGICREIQLKGLSTAELTAVIGSLSSKPIGMEITKAVANEAGGSPLFAVETFRLLAESGSLVLVNDVWGLRKGAQLDLPSTIREVILRRIDRLPVESRRILDLASVIGRDFEPTIISKGLSKTAIDVLDILDQLQGEYHLVEEGKSGFLFSHDLIRKVTYDRVSSPRRKEYHRIVGEILEESIAKEHNYGILSYHFFEAGVRSKCISYSILAGEACNERFAYSEAIPYFNRALAGMKKESAESADYLRAHEGLADAHHESLDFEESYKRYQSLLEMSLNNTMRARILRKCAECWVVGRLGKGDGSKSKGLLEEANEIVGVDPVEKAQILSELSVSALQEGDFSRSENLSSEAIKIFEKNSKYAMLAWEITINGSLGLDVGNLNLALEKMQRAREILKDHPWPWAEMRNSDYYSRILFSLGRYQEALKEASASFDLSQKLGEFHQCAVSLFFEALIYEIYGCRELAEDYAEKSMEFSLKCTGDQLATMPLSLISHLKTKGGDISGAQECCKEARFFIQKLDISVKTFLNGLLTCAEAEIFISNGDVEKGTEHFQTAVESLKGVQMGEIMEALIRTWIAGAYLRRGDLHDARSQYQSASDIYEKIGNASQVKRITAIVNDLCNRSCLAKTFND